MMDSRLASLPTVLYPPVSPVGSRLASLATPLQLQARGVFCQYASNAGTKIRQGFLIVDANATKNFYANRVALDQHEKFARNMAFAARIVALLIKTTIRSTVGAALFDQATGSATTAIVLNQPTS